MCGFCRVGLNLIAGRGGGGVKIFLIPFFDPIFDPVFDPEQSSGGGFPNGGQEDGRAGQHLWCSGSSLAFQASDPGSNPGRRSFSVCDGFPNRFSIRKSIRKSDGTTMENMFPFFSFS